MGKLKEGAPGKLMSRLTATDIEKWVKAIVKHEDNIFYPAIVERSIKSFRVKMNISDQKSRILMHCRDFFQRLKSIATILLKTKILKWRPIM